MKIYISSKVKHAQRWIDMAEQGVPFGCRWIYMLPEDWQKVWDYCFEDIKECDALILYADGNDILYGALIEVGYAISLGKPIYFVGDYGAIKTILDTHYIKQKATLKDALKEVIDGIKRDT